MLRMSIFLGGSDMVRTPRVGTLVLLLVGFHIGPIGNLWAQAPGTAGHEQ